MKFTLKNNKECHTNEQTVLEMGKHHLELDGFCSLNCFGFKNAAKMYFIYMLFLFLTHKFICSAIMVLETVAVILLVLLVKGN
jgi:hypothetical protein